jgi:hypothetical protein
MLVGIILLIVLHLLVNGLVRRMLERRPAPIESEGSEHYS